MGFFKKLLNRESNSSSNQPPVPPRGGGGGGGSSGPPPGGGGGAGGSGGGGGVSIRLNLPHEPRPENLPLLAEMVVKNEAEAGVTLDYSIESLKQIDTVLSQLRAEGATPSSVPDMVFCMGCYVGEVMRRKYGGEWVEPRADIPLGPFPLLRYGNGSHCAPIGKAFKCLQNGAGDSVHYFSGVMHPSAMKQG